MRPQERNHERSSWQPCSVLPGVVSWPQGPLQWRFAPRRDPQIQRTVLTIHFKENGRGPVDQVKGAAG